MRPSSERFEAMLDRAIAAADTVQQAAATAEPARTTAANGWIEVQLG